MKLTLDANDYLEGYADLHSHLFSMDDIIWERWDDSDVVSVVFSLPPGATISGIEIHNLF